MLDIPVLLVIFNRPDTALQVIRAIKKIKPARVYIAADGPRFSKEGEDKACKETREVVMREIDWDCQLQTFFRDSNAGCALNVSSAINWFFEQEEMGIILEDDCLPHESFFLFCKELLEYYKYDDRIMHISGFNEQDGISRGNASYYFSYYPSIWGWATWRRAWQHYKLRVENVDENLQKSIIDTAFYGFKKAGNRWFNDFQKASKVGSAWGYQWPFCIWQRHALSITANIPLIKNIGFDNRGTHTNSNNKKMMEVTLAPADQVIRHPASFLPNRDADLLSYRKHLVPKLFKRAKMKTRYLFKIYIKQGFKSPKVIKHFWSLAKT